jgi:hypothetical protein
MPETELPQQGSDRRGRVYAVEQSLHAARTHHVDIVDAVRADAHPPDQGRQLRGRIGRTRLDPRLGDMNLLGQQLGQAGLLGQPHHRHQPSTRHEVVVVE